jgi:hypothetical protein
LQLCYEKAINQQKYFICLKHNACKGLHGIWFVGLLLKQYIMKKIFLAVAACLCLLALPMKAQIIKAGVNLANVTISDNGDIDNNRILTSFHVGIVGDIKITSHLYFQPGVLFTGKGSKVRSGDDDDQTYFEATTNPYYIEIPANLVLKTSEGPVRFFIGAGPYAGIGIAGKNKVEGKYLGTSFSSENKIEWSDDDPLTLDYEEDAGIGRMRRFDFGLNGTTGLEFNKLALGINFGLGLTKLQSGADSRDDDNNKHRVFSIFLGLKL